MCRAEKRPAFIFLESGMSHEKKSFIPCPCVFDNLKSFYDALKKNTYGLAQRWGKCSSHGRPKKTSRTQSKIRPYTIKIEQATKSSYGGRQASVFASFYGKLNLSSQLTISKAQEAPFKKSYRSHYPTTATYKRLFSC